MLNRRAAVSRDKLSLNGILVLGFFVFVINIIGCAAGRSLSKAELSEFESLANEKTQLETQTRDARRQLQRTFSRISVHPDADHVLLCGEDSKKLSTGKVPLVYAKPKRVIFKPIRKRSRNGCALLVIEVKP